jgi:single-strand DNA-binding protein
MDLNKAMVIGRLTRDPEVRTTPTGTSVCSFSIATNYTYKNATGKQEQVEYHNIVAWGKIGEIAGQYLKKGSRVYVEGRIQTRSWQGNDGQKKNRTEIVLENMIMLDSKGGAPGASPAAAEPNTFMEALEEELPTINQEVADDEIRVEDIPF